MTQMSMRPAAAREAAMTTPTIVDFRRNLKAQESAPAPDRVLKGEPKTWVRNYYTDPSQQFFAGTWETVEAARKRYATFEAAKPA